jgi:chemotaxis protein MotB
VEGKMILPENIIAAGYADTKPIELNNSDENRAKNRRVEILILNKKDSEIMLK